MKRIMVLASGNGTNLEALIAAEKNGRLKGGRIVLVTSDKPEAFALKRAKRAGIVTNILTSTTRAGISADVLNIARQNEIDIIVLAGFMRILDGELMDAYSGRIVNLHPSLLPKFGGVGMYGSHVHEAVLAAGETESGATVHTVTAVVDDPTDILVQRRVPVLPDDTPDSLAERIHTEEHIAIVDGVNKLIKRLPWNGEA
jgi:phosphoribosylglycinamide formyltransferase-1